MRRLLGLAYLAVLVAVLLLTWSAPKALANHVQCGDVITEDTRLDSDLIDCPGDGIVIGADGITLDLGGHLVDGVRTSSFSAGVRNPRFAHITVQNGRVSQFRDGVTLEYLSSDNVVRGLLVTDTIAGIYPHGSSNFVENNRISLAGVGIDVYGPTTARRNTLDGNGTGIRTHEQAEITNNVIVRSGGSGILLVETRDSVISRNLLLGNGGQQGFPHGAGITMRDVADSVIERNVVAGNIFGMQLAEYSARNVIRKNEASSNAFDGIWLIGGSENLVDHNSASNNGDDGIDFDPEDGGPVELRRNRVDRNGDLGIEAEGQVIDGRGNRAFGNGNPLQCLNVACK